MNVYADCFSMLSRMFRTTRDSRRSKAEMTCVNFRSCERLSIAFMRRKDSRRQILPAIVVSLRRHPDPRASRFKFELDREALPLIYASHLFYDSWFGLKPFDRYVRIIAPPAPSAPASFRFKHSLVARLQQLYEHRTQKKVWAWEIDAAKAEEISRQIDAFRPHFVMGYTSTLAAIADELLRRGRKLDGRLRGVITIAETLSAERRNRIEEYFEAPIINRYGLREFGSWSAQSCRVSPERLHVNSELVFCEILRPDGTAAAEGETGRVILTDLCNYARPFIRYDTGDLATVGKSRCPCGRGFALIGPIEGRSQECLRTPSGKLISPAVLGHRLFVYSNNLEAICRYQLVWETADFARLLIVPTANWNPERRRLLEDDLSDLLHYEMRVSVEAVSEIRPEKSGKRPIIKVVAP